MLTFILSVFVIIATWMLQKVSGTFQWILFLAIDLCDFPTRMLRNNAILRFLLRLNHSKSFLVIKDWSLKPAFPHSESLFPKKITKKTNKQKRKTATTLQKQRPLYKFPMLRSGLPQFPIFVVVAVLLYFESWNVKIFIVSLSEVM